MPRRFDDDEGPTQDEDGTMANDAEKRRRDFGAEDKRFTTKGDTLYAMGLEWPADRKLVIRALARDKQPHSFPVKQVRLLGHRGRISWQQTDQGLEVQLPEKQPCDYAYTLKIER